MKPLTLPEPLQQVRTLARERWKALAPRERLVVTVMAWVVGLGLVWLIAVSPALDTLHTAPVQLARLDADLQLMRRYAAEARELRASPPVSATQAAAALRAATERLGTSARLNIVGDRATLNLTGVEAPAVTTWLSEVRVGARARVIDAKLSRSGTGYTGSIVLALRGAS